MKLHDLLNGIGYMSVCGDANVDVLGVVIDSRLVKPGDLFVATVGREADGHDYVTEAVEKGASAVLIGAGRDVDLELPVPVASVPDTRAVLSRVVNRLHGEPSRRFTLIGVTGTNGKTSVATMIDHVLKRSGMRTALFGTIGNYCLSEAVDIRRTTPTNPDCVELGELMARAAEAGVDALTMEVTSMGLAMGRVGACDFDVAVFTNLSPEHLDDHGTMEDYKASKLILFEMAKKAVVNADDPAAAEFAARAGGPVIRYGVRDRDACDLYAANVEYLPGGVRFEMISRSGGSLGGESARVWLATPAEFAVYNALAAAAACAVLGVPLSDSASALSEGVDIAGRYEALTSDDGVTAIVDYAHTAGALENLLGAVRANPSYSRLISVFGCGGDRDPGKRRPMGEISGRLADYTVITSDNPRTEDPAAIISGVEEGAAASGGAYEIELDRAKAIEKAIRAAKPGDVVVIAGKGHEDYQIIGREKVHLDDREIAGAALDDRVKEGGLK